MSRSYLRFHIFVCVIAIVVATHVLAQVPETPLQCNGDLDATIAYGNIIQCSSNPIGDTDNIAFQGTVGETITVAIQKLAGDGTPLFRINAPDGTLLADWNILSRVTLTQTGFHTILVAESSFDQIVDYTVTLERVTPPSPSAIPIPYAQPLIENLDPLADLDSFFFSASAGDIVNVTVSFVSGIGSPVFQIYAPDGTLITDWTTSSQPTLTQTGLHAILLAESFIDQTVNYSITLQCISGVCGSTIPPPPPPPTDVSAFAGTYQGTYAGDDSGSFTVVIDTIGNISGTGNSVTFGVFDIFGNVDASGNLELVGGDTTLGAIFSGSIAPGGTVSGTWESTIFFASGTFSGSKTGP